MCRAFSCVVGRVRLLLPVRSLGKTEELYKKDLHDPNNHDNVITHLEPDIVECEVKWALGSITTNKASGGDGIPAELFKILRLVLILVRMLVLMLLHLLLIISHMVMLHQQVSILRLSQKVIQLQ